MRSLSLLVIAAFSHSLGSPLQVLEPYNTEEEVSQVWFEDIDGNKLTDEDLVELPDHDVTSLLDRGRRGRSLASGRISQQLLDSFKKNGTLTVDDDGLTCVKKLMSVEYTDYTEAMTCVHKTKERCHDTFVTQFQPHQEQVCDEKFEKTCIISYENVAVNEEVEVCKTYLCPDCTRDGPDECQTVYDTVCETKRKVHEVEDDVVNCETLVEQKCVDVVDGFLTKQECDSWPVEKCSVEKVKVRKTTPDTSCREQARELCAPKGCAEKQCHSCENQVKAAVIAKPVEECDLEPEKVCRHVTKLVPHLVSTTECVDVPQEVCGVSKIHPVKKTRPAIKNWCFKNNIISDPPPTPTPSPETDDKCAENSDCKPGWLCVAGKCQYPSGKVLLKSVVFRGFEGLNAEEVTTVIFGEKTKQSPLGVTCNFTSDPKSHYWLPRQTPNQIIRPSPSHSGFVVFSDQKSLGGCWEFPLNARLSEGGTVEVTGIRSWAGVEMCVNWDNDENISWTCSLEPVINPVVGVERHYKTNCVEGGVCAGS